MMTMMTMATTSTTRRKHLLPSTASSCLERKQQGKFIEINAKMIIA